MSDALKVGATLPDIALTAPDGSAVRLSDFAGKKLVLIVKNLDGKAEEFESKDLKLEKIVAAGKEIRLNVGPLKPGEYKFVGEYHEKTAKGVLVAK